MSYSTQPGAVEDPSNRESWMFSCRVSLRSSPHSYFLSLTVTFNIHSLVISFVVIHHRNMAEWPPESYSVVVCALLFKASSLLFKLSLLSSVGSVLLYMDLGGAMLVSSCCSANRSLSFSCRTFSSLEMRLPMRYIISQIHMKIHSALDTTMNSMKIFFSVGRLMKQSTVLGHGSTEHLDNLIERRRSDITFTSKTEHKTGLCFL